MTISVEKGLVSGAGGWGLGAGGWGGKRALVFLGLIIPRGQCATEMR